MKGENKMVHQQATLNISEGKCCLCNATFSKRSMKKHIDSCKKKRFAPDKSSNNKQLGQKMHILVEGGGKSEYWMHIDVAGSALLKDLDNFLRDTWLECCGHMSVFEIQGKRYVNEAMDEFGEKSMDIRLNDVLLPKMKFTHEYDFGSPTRLDLKVVAEIEGEIDDTPVRILARNEPPVIPCAFCKEEATDMCTDCDYDESWLCDECASEHECGEDRLLPVVNSPRVGVCGYCG